MSLAVKIVKKDVDRLTASEKRFAQLGLQFERLEAFSGRDMSEEDFDAFVATRPRDGKYKWTRGKIGCFMSHSQAWKICAEGEDKYVAVLEDDLHISDEMPHFINDESWMPKDFDIIRMESPTNRIKVLAETELKKCGRNIYRVGSTSWCAGSYIISKQGAQKLMNVPEKFHHNPDRLMFCYEDSVIANKLRTYQISPSLTIQDKYLYAGSSNATFQSNIETPDVVSTDRVTLSDKLKHLNISEMILVAKKTFMGYKRIPFKP